MQKSKKKTSNNKVSNESDTDNKKPVGIIKKTATNYDSFKQNNVKDNDEVIYLDPKEHYRMSTTNPQTDLRKTITISGANRGRSPGGNYAINNSPGAGSINKHVATDNNNYSSTLNHNQRYEDGHSIINNNLNSSLNNITNYYSRNNERSPVGKVSYKENTNTNYNNNNNNNNNNIQTISYGAGTIVENNTGNLNKNKNNEYFNTINHNNLRKADLNNNNLLFTNPNMYSYMQPNNNFNNFNENTYSIIRNDRNNFIPNEGTFNTLNNTFTNNYGYGQNTFLTRNNNFNLNDNTVDVSRVNEGYYNYYVNPNTNVMVNEINPNDINNNQEIYHPNRSPNYNRSPVRDIDNIEENYNTNIPFDNNNNNNINNNDINPELITQHNDQENVKNNNVTIHIDSPEIKKNKMDEIRRLNAYYKDNFVNRYNNIKVIRVNDDENYRSSSNDNQDKVNALYNNYAQDIDKLKELGLASRLILAKHTKIFNKYKQEGRLLNQKTQVFSEIKPISEEELINRGTVIKKFKKLSSVLLSKSQKPSNRVKSSLSLNRVDEDDIEDDYDIIKNNLRESKSVDNKYDNNNNTTQNKPFMAKGRIFTGTKTKFIRITMAMLSSKGPFCEDRIITRDMRFDKGGVVDLAQKQNKKDEKYKIKKVLGSRSPQAKERYKYSQRDREKAAKICQAWWRNILGKYQELLNKIIKIQSFWRGKWMRMNMVDIIYATTLLNTFQNMIFKVVRRHCLRDGMNELLKFGDKYSARLYLTLLVKIQLYVKNWLQILRDKRRRLGNELEKIFYRRKKDTFDDLNDYADYKRKLKEDDMEKLKHFLLISKKNTRRAIFHDMFYELLFDKPKRQYRSARIKNTLKNKSKTELFFLNSILRRRFLHWAMVAQARKLADDHSKDDTKEKKYYALIQIIKNGEILAKKKALEVTIPPLLVYLYSLLRQRMTKNLVLTNSKLSRIALRSYWNKWNKKVNLLRQKEVRNNFFASLSEKSGSKIRLKFLRKYFLRWNRTKPKNMEIIFYLASEKLKNGINRLQVRKPISAFKEKIYLENAKSGMQHAFGLKDKYIKRHWREYFYKWYKTSNHLKSQELIDTMALKILGGFNCSFKNRILQKWFSHWKKTPKINLTDVYNRFKLMLNFIQKIIDYNVRKHAPPLFDHLKDANNVYKMNKGLRSAVKRKGDNNNMLLKAYFWNWRTRAIKLAEIQLQQAIGSKFIKNWSGTQERFSLYKHFMRWFNNVQRAKIMQDRARGKILHDILEKKYRYPFNKLKLASIWLPRISKLREVCPRVLNALTRKFVPSKLRKWHNNVVGYDQDKMDKMNKWLKNMQGEEYEARLRAKNKLFLKHFARLDKQNGLKKFINLKKWKKNKKLIDIEQGSTKIQAMFRGVKVRERRLIEEQRDKIRKLISRVFYRNILYKFQEVNDYIRPLKQNLFNCKAEYENRRIINNMISISNNALRNTYLEKLTGKKCFNADKMSLKYWLNLWKRIGDKMNKHALLIQTNLRRMHSKRKVDKLFEIRERLYLLALKNEETAKGKLKLALRLWNSKANHLKMLEDARKIISFCRLIVAKDENDKFNKSFIDWSKKIVNKRLNNGAKFYKLRETLRKLFAVRIISKIDKKDKRNKFSDLMRKFAKGLSDKESAAKNKSDLRSMFRIYFIKYLKDNCDEPAKMVKSRYMIRLAFMHKNINDKRTYRELIRKWKYYVMMNKFLKKKAEHVYKQMHINYLNIVNNMFGNDKADGFGNGSLYNESEHLAKGMGLFKFADPNLVTYDEENNNYSYEKVTKKYVFKHVDKNYEIDEEENIVNDKSSNYYTNRSNNTSNTGKYKENTINTQKSFKNK